MHDRELEATNPERLRAGIRVSVASIVWTIASSAVAIGLGLGAGSLVLVAFGATGLLDAAGSSALVVHFRHSLRHEAFSERHERVALRVVTAGLFVVGAATIAESVRRLATGQESDTVWVGTVVAGLSACVLGALARAKRRIASEIPSRALLADGWLSTVGGLLAAVAVAGTAFPAADAVAAAIVGVGALAVAVMMFRR